MRAEERAQIKTTTEAQWTRRYTEEKSFSYGKYKGKSKKSVNLSSSLLRRV